MVEIRPFRGYLYNPGVVKDISSVVAPPWDVIDGEEEKRLLSSSEWNVIRLISQGIRPSEAESRFHGWIRERVLIRDGSDSFYSLRHNFSHAGKIVERKGIFALLKIEDFKKGNIIPHEHVFEKYHNNRYKLIEKCRANFSPVFMLYADREKRIEDIIDRTPVECEGAMKEDRFRFGRIGALGDVERIKSIINPEKLLIADGHHRYQAAYRFYADNPDETNGYILVFLANLESPGLMILPTHRYIPHDVSFLRSMASFEEYFHVEKAGGMDAMFEKMGKLLDKHAFGIYEEGSYYLINLKDAGKTLQEFGQDGHSTEWLALDNVILKNIILDRILNLGEKEISYHASPEYLLAGYGRRKKGFIAFVNPVSKDAFLKISLNNEKMPQKTTYFYPKVPTGLVINKF